MTSENLVNDIFTNLALLSQSLLPHGVWKADSFAACQPPELAYVQRYLSFLIRLEQSYIVNMAALLHFVAITDN